MTTVFSYKDSEKLKEFVSSQGRIIPRSKTGLKKKEQNRLAREIERARHLALINYTQTL